MIGGLAFYHAKAARYSVVDLRQNKRQRKDRARIPVGDVDFPTDARVAQARA